MYGIPNVHGGDLVSEPRTESRAPRILVVGTLDTKADEMRFIVDEIERLGGLPIVLDSGVGAPPGEALTPDIRQEDIALIGGLNLSDVWSLPRGEAVSRMRSAVTAVVERLQHEDGIDGALCVGGAGAHIAGPAFQQLRMAIPKMIVSPLASGSRQFEPYVGVSNVAVMHSVVDIAGLNDMAKDIYRQASGYIVGAASAMLNRPSPDRSCTRALIAVSMNGNTTPAIDKVRTRLENSGFDVVAFHANGVGGRAMERMIEAGRFVAVLDFTTTELAGAEFGGLMDPGPGRMEVAGGAGVPQVLVPGCLDFITVGRFDVAQAEFPDHRLFRHNPELTLVRMNTDQMTRLAEVFARKANAASSPTTVCVPTGGLSIPGAEGGPFWDPDADQAFLETLQARLVDRVKLRIVDSHINGSRFVDAVLQELSTVMAESKFANEGDPMIEELTR